MDALVMRGIKAAKPTKAPAWDERRGPAEVWQEVRGRPPARPAQMGLRRRWRRRPCPGTSAPGQGSALAGLLPLQKENLGAPA